MLKNLLPFLICLLLFTSCSKDERAITYQVECEKCKITYLDEKGEYQVREEVSGSFNYSFEINSGRKAHIAAQNAVDIKSPITAILIVDGEELERKTSDIENFASVSIDRIIE